MTAAILLSARVPNILLANLPPSRMSILYRNDSANKTILEIRYFAYVLPNTCIRCTASVFTRFRDDDKKENAT